jgi:hypothetical protein
LHFFKFSVKIKLMPQLNQKGAINIIPVLVIVIAVGVISFLLLSSFAPVKSSKLTKAYQKPNALAANVCDPAQTVCPDRDTASVTVIQNQGFIGGDQIGFWSAGPAFNLVGQGARGYTMFTSGFPSGIYVIPSSGAFANNTTLPINVEVHASGIPFGTYSGTVNFIGRNPDGSVNYDVPYSVALTVNYQAGVSDVTVSPTSINATGSSNQIFNTQFITFNYPGSHVVDVNTVPPYNSILVGNPNPGFNGLFYPFPPSTSRIVNNSAQVGLGFFSYTNNPNPPAGVYSGYLSFIDSSRPSGLQEILRVPYTVTINPPATPAPQATAIPTPAPTATPAPTIAPTVPPTPAPTPVPSPLGYTKIGTQVDVADSNYLNGSKFTTDAVGGFVRSMSVYVADVDPAPNNQYQMAIYSANGGQPGSLLASTQTGTLTANSWNTLPISLLLLPNTKYFLVYNSNGLNQDSNNMTLDINNNNFYGAYSATSVKFGNWPQNFGTAITGNWNWSIYASF